jgi:hypothetical protein
LRSDQRGFGRPAPATGKCDVGAFEAGAKLLEEVNDLVHLDSYTGAFFPPGAGGGPLLPYAPAGTFSINAIFTNTSAQNICNVAFQVVELTPPNVLLDLGGRLVGGVGAVWKSPASVKNFLKGTTEHFVFAIGLGTTNIFRFFVNMVGDPTSGACPP